MPAAIRSSESTFRAATASSGHAWVRSTIADGSPDWRGFLGAFLHERGVTDVILFGDCRPYHRVAVDLARSRGIAVHVFEEGYFRPDWITLERDGTNGHSRLPRGPGSLSGGSGDHPGDGTHSPAGERRHSAAGALGDSEPGRNACFSRRSIRTTAAIARTTR